MPRENLRLFCVHSTTKKISIQFFSELAFLIVNVFLHKVNFKSTLFEQTLLTLLHCDYSHIDLTILCDSNRRSPFLEQILRKGKRVIGKTSSEL